MAQNVHIPIVPSNLVPVEISAEHLKTPLPPSVSSPHPLLVPSSALPSAVQPERPRSVKEEDVAHAQAAAVGSILNLFVQAKNPIILLDALTERLGAEELVMELAEETGITVFVSPMGKSAVWEGHGLFGGVSTSLICDPRNEAELLLISWP